MEGRSESDRGGDEVYSATFSDEEKNELKLDGVDDDRLKAIPELNGEITLKILVGLTIASLCRRR